MAKTTRILELSKTLPHGPNRVATQPWKGPTQFGHKVVSLALISKPATICFRSLIAGSFLVIDHFGPPGHHVAFVWIAIRGNLKAPA